jgi:ligand-binding sensor domain-containing protein
MKNFITIVLILISLESFAKGRWTTYKVENGSSPKNDITAICFDQYDSLWVSTMYGIYKYADGKWECQGLENKYVHTLLIDHDNTKWAGLWGGGVVRSTDGINWVHIPEASKSNSTNVISVDKNGSIWAGDWNEGLYNLTRQADGKDKWIIYTSEEVGIGDNSILSILSASKNQMWFGTYHGVSLFENNIWTLYNKQNSKLPDDNVYSLASDKKGHIWIGTGNGLVNVSGTKWTIYNNENSKLSCDLVLSLAIDPKGNLWVGTNKGVFVFDGKNWINYTSENSPLPNNRIQAIVVRNNKIYIGTSSGLAVYEDK